MELVIEETENDRPKEPTLCLNMIVKNESKIIKRLLESVLPIIDTYCICDTGSTDNTIEIIESFFQNHGIHGKIVLEPFVNFQHNRNVALQACLGMSDYILFLDADMILEIKKFNKNLLNTSDSFLILQGSEHFYYQNIRIVKNNGLYSYYGVTHEYINCPHGNRSITFDKDVLFINDIGDGGAKGDKFERDIRLLTEAIKENPRSERYHFYLANTYHDSGHYNEAINIYKKRIELGGWEQEVWFSYYRIGLCYRGLNEIEKAIYYWLEAYNYFQPRIENLYEIVNYYRYSNKHKLAFLFSLKAIESMNKLSSHQKDSFLFLSNDVYTYKIDYEYSIVAAYNGIKNINDSIVNILNNCTNHGIIQNTFQNMKFYKYCLTPTRVVDLTETSELFLGNEHTILNSSSTCIIPNPHKEGYLLNIRFVNYYINERGIYLNCDTYIATQNKFVELNNNFELIKSKWFDINFEDRRYIGIEDIRIIHIRNDNKLTFIGTALHKNNRIGIVNGDYNLEENKLIPKELNSSFSNNECEKNWVYTDEGYIIYKWHPIHVCQEKDGILYLLFNKNTPNIFKHVRGSTNGFTYNNEIWFVGHLVSYEQPRHYYHILFVLDKDFNLLRYTAPFKFEETCIEYSLGLVVEDDRVLITYSNIDRTSKIGVYSKTYIDGLLKYNP